MKKTSTISLESIKHTKTAKSNTNQTLSSRNKNTSTKKESNKINNHKPLVFEPKFNMNQQKKEQSKETVTTVVNPVRNLFEKIKLRMDRQHDSPGSLFIPPASLQTDIQKSSDNEVIVINEQIPDDVVLIDDADITVQLDANLSNNNEEKPKPLEKQCSSCKQTDSQTECTHLEAKLIQKQPECSHHSECKPIEKQPDCFCSTVKKTECLSCETECSHLISDRQTKCPHLLNKPMERQMDKPRKRRNNLPTIPLDLFNSSMLLRSELKTPQPKATAEPVVRKIDNKPEKCCNKPKKSASISSENLVYEVVKQNSTEQAEGNSYTDENNDVVIVESANPKVEPLIIKLKVSQNNKTEPVTVKKFIDKPKPDNNNKPLKSGENFNLNTLDEPLVVEQTENSMEQPLRQLRSNRARKSGQVTEEVEDENKSLIEESEKPKINFTESLIKESSKKAKFQARYENLSIDLLDYANMTIDTTTPRRLRSVRLQNTPNAVCNLTTDGKEDPNNTESLSNLDKTIESVVNGQENSKHSANKNVRKRVTQKKASVKIGKVFKIQPKPKKSINKKSAQSAKKSGKTKKLPAKSDLQQPRSLRSKSKSFKPSSIEVKKELIEEQPVTRVEQKVIAIVHHEPKPKSTHATETRITEETKKTRQRKPISENLNEIKPVKEKSKPKKPQKGKPAKKPSELHTDKPVNKPKFVKHTKLIQRIVEELKNTILNRSKSSKKLSVAIKNKLQLKVARRKMLRRKAELKRQLRSRESGAVKEETTVHLVDGCLEEIAGKKQTDSIVIINDVTVNKTVEDMNDKKNAKKSDITVFDFQDTEPDETPLRLKFVQPMKDQTKTPFDDEFIETLSRSPIKNEQTQSIVQSSFGDNQPKKLWSIIDTPKTPRPSKTTLQFINMASQYLKDDDSQETSSMERDSQLVQEKKSPLKQPTIIEMFSKAWKKRDVKQDIFSNIPPKTEPVNNQNNSPSPTTQKASRSPRRDQEDHEHDEMDKDSDTESRMEWVPEEYAEYKMKYSMQYSRKLLKSNKPTFKCKVCQMPQPTYYKLLKHRRVHEGQDRPHVCPHCGSEFREVEDFSAHLRVHKGKHPYMCHKCDSGFWTKKAYQAHAAVHVLRKPKPPAKKFRCDVCSKEFAKLCDVERHARVHTGEKPSVCNICNKGFVQAHNLSKHLLTHLHVKPFVCEICDKKFGRNDVLRRHLLTHSVRKPVGCEVCGRGFIRRSQLVQHVRKKHPERLSDFETA